MTAVFETAVESVGRFWEIVNKKTPFFILNNNLNEAEFQSTIHKNFKL